jgi:hypothetical protein
VGFQFLILSQLFIEIEGIADCKIMRQSANAQFVENGFAMERGTRRAAI